MHSSITGSAPIPGASNIRTAEPPPASPSPPVSPRARLASQHGVPPLRPPVQPQMRRGPSASGGTGSGDFIVDIEAAVHEGKGKQPAIQERGEGSGAAPIGLDEFAEFLQWIDTPDATRPDFIARHGNRPVPMTPQIVEMMPPTVQAIGRRLQEEAQARGIEPEMLSLGFIAALVSADRALSPHIDGTPPHTGRTPMLADSHAGDIGDFIRTGRCPDMSGACDDVTAALRSALARASEVSSSTFHAAAGQVRGGVAQLAEAPAQFARAAAVMAAFIERVAANEDFESTPATIAASVVNVAARNALAVLLPTAIRQFLSFGIEAAFTHARASDNVKTTFGLMAPLLATAALAMGAVRDSMAGTETTTSRRSRAIMGATTLVTGVATAATGAMPGVASLMLAFTLYTAMRDLVVQSRLRMNNPNTAGQAPDATHFSLISIGYGIDQALVNLGMSTLASPSGATAFVQHAGVQARNALRRAAINWAGENGEDLMFQSIPALRSLFGPAENRHALQLGIRDVGYQRNNVVNGALGPWAVRTGILATSFGLTGMLSAHLRDPRYVNNPRLVEAVNDLLLGVLNGVLYEPFANAGSGQPSAAQAAAAAQAHEVVIGNDRGRDAGSGRTGEATTVLRRRPVRASDQDVPPPEATLRRNQSF